MTNEEAMLESCYTLRGKILDFTINLEMLVVSYITQHFSQSLEKEDELALVVLGELTTSAKFEIFKTVFNQHCTRPDDFKEDISKRLTKIIKNRNTIAHQMLDVSERAQKSFAKNKVLTFYNLGETNAYKRGLDFKRRFIYEKEASKMVRLIGETHNALLPFVKTK